MQGAEVSRGKARRDLLPLLLWVLPLVFLAVFFFQPLVAIFQLVLDAFRDQGISAGILSRIWRPLWFTIYQAGLSTLFTMLVGLPAAYVFGRYKFAGKDFLRVMTTLPFILPTVVVAAAFNALLGPRGWVNLFLMDWFNLTRPPVQLLNSLEVIVLAHVFYNTTIVIRTVGGAWEQLDPRLEHAGRVLGASAGRVLREITLPLLKPALLSALLLVFLFDFTSFGVVLLLGGPQYATLEVEVYIQALQMLNLPLAGLLSAVQMACTLLITAVYSVVAGQGVVPLMPRLRGEALKRITTWRDRLIVGFTLLVMLVLLISPLIALSVRSVTRLDSSGEGIDFTLTYYQEMFINRRQSLFYVPPIDAARNSLLYAAATVAISLVLGFLAAYSLARPSRINRLLDPLLMLPLGASAVTLGLGYIIVFNRPPIDVRSFPLLIPIAHSLVALPFVVRTLQPALASIPISLRQAAAVLGASPWQVWREVDLPIVSRAAAVAAIFSFTISLGEFGATTFLSRPEFPTLPIAISRFLSQPGELNYGQALAMATLLMLVCALSVFILERVRLPGSSSGEF